MQNSLAIETQDMFRSRDNNSRFRPYEQKTPPPPYTEKYTEPARPEQQTNALDSDDKVETESVPETDNSKTPSPSGSPYRATTSSSTR